MNKNSIWWRLTSNRALLPLAVLIAVPLLHLFARSRVRMAENRTRYGENVHARRGGSSWFHFGTYCWFAAPGGLAPPERRVHSNARKQSTFSPGAWCRASGNRAGFLSRFTMLERTCAVHSFARTFAPATRGRRGRVLSAEKDVCSPLRAPAPLREKDLLTP